MTKLKTSRPQARRCNCNEQDRDLELGARASESGLNPVGTRAVRRAGVLRAVLSSLQELSAIGRTMGFCYDESRTSLSLSSPGRMASRSRADRRTTPDLVC